MEQHAVTPFEPGPASTSGSLSDVPGVQVGHVERTGDGWQTGVTVILPPPGTLGAVEVRGAAPATHETDALARGAVAPFPSAVVLSGGSAFGLRSTAGVVAWCAERGLGFRVGPGPSDVVPVVPAAAIFDLGRGGDPRATPDETMGYAAAQAAADGSTAQRRGNVGAGAGAAIDQVRAKGGLGGASQRLVWPGGGVTVAALAVVNALGTLSVGPHGGLAPVVELPPASGAPANTTLVVVATDAALTHDDLHRLAGAGHTGLARVLDPVHTAADGDTCFALSTGRTEPPSAAPGALEASYAVQVALHAAAAHVVAAAVVDAVRSARPVRTPALHLPVLADRTAD